MKDFSVFEKELLSDPEVKAIYDSLEEEYKLASALIEKRIKRQMTQKELAKKIGTKQSAIARLESGASNPTFAFLKRVAHGLDSKLRISLV